MASNFSLSSLSLFLFLSFSLSVFRSKTSFNSPIQVCVAGRKLVVWGRERKRRGRGGERCHRMKSSEVKSEIL